MSGAQGNPKKLTRRIGPSECEDIHVSQTPIADFTITCTYLDCFVAAGNSYDPDGWIVDYYWNFVGVGLSGSGETASHTYESPGTYTVLLQVTDNEGTVGKKWITPTVAEYVPPLPGFNLTAEGYKSRGGFQNASLTWTGAMSGEVHVYRNGALIVTTPNDGSHIDKTSKRGAGTYKYKLCRGRNNHLFQRGNSGVRLRGVRETVLSVKHSVSTGASYINSSFTGFKHPFGRSIRHPAAKETEGPACAIIAAGPFSLPKYFDAIHHCTKLYCTPGHAQDLGEHFHVSDFD